MNSELQPGLLVLHGNRAEWLAEAVFEWLQQHPLQPLEEEIFLVQSNGVAEWLKTTLAAHAGICAATRVELPARFLWRAYRQWLGHDAVPVQSALDKLPLTWRLMARLPALLPRPGFEPLAGFLRDGDAGRRLQLAQRLADLYDQYQVYRPDWLQAWADSRDSLPRGPGLPAEPLPADQRWQALLWRELLAPLPEPERAAIRPRLHQRFLQAVAAGAAPLARVPRRVVLFGMTHVPLPTLQALAALSARAQVVLAIPNPCRYHWADIIDGRELLRAERRRHPLRQGLDLAAVALEDMHAHAHPLLAAWGRQGRDFVRQLDAFDDAMAARQRFALPRVDLFDEGPGVTLLQQVQARIRDLVPLHEHAALAAAQGLDAADRSIVFHVAHSAQREVEILHDQLLEWLAHPPGGRPLHPRDVVVMVPDIELFAPAIRAVFGQLPRDDARFIPYGIADLQDRGHDALLVALEWLLRLPQQRCGLSEVRDLLDVPAVARRFGLTPEQLPRLAAWMQGAGVRWGLDEAHRAGLGLGACGEPNTWLFGLRRMLLGYAVGAPAPGETGDFNGIEPYEEVGGLEAALAGSLADIVAAMLDWLAQAHSPATPARWAERGHTLLAAFFDPDDERERTALAAAHEALHAWLDACAGAGFEQAVELAVAREAWLVGIDEPGLGRRFRAGGVTFCTLLPLRAIPFEVVCLLGMNDGDYPRRGLRSDFDLMGRPGQQRPGDRSRRDDDRQLMLEALLSARRVLYVSWAGRSVRDNSVQPPSVLVSQLRDYLAAGWGEAVLPVRTTWHPLQPFSRRYFEMPTGVEAPAGVDATASAEAASRAGAPALFTHAREWRAAHLPAVPASAAAAAPPLAGAVGATPADGEEALTVAALVSFLKNPVKDFFRHRLNVVFGDEETAVDDDEPFGLAGLAEYALMQELVEALAPALDAGPVPDLAVRVAAQVARVQRAGRLPLGAPGRRSAQALAAGLLPMLARWQALQAQFARHLPHRVLSHSHDGLWLNDWLTGLRGTGSAGEDGPGGEAGEGAAVWLELSAGRLCADAKKGQPRGDRLITAWVRMLASSTCGVAVAGVMVGRDACVTVRPWPAERARAALGELMQAWREGRQGSGAPLPLAPRTALALVRGVSDVAGVYEGSDFGHRRGEAAEACLARSFPDYAALVADGRFEALAQRLFAPLAAWIDADVQVEVFDTGGAVAPAGAAHV